MAIDKGTSASTRQSRSHLTFRRSLVYAAVLSCFAGEAAYANPTGPAVVNGQVSISRQGSVLNVTNSPGSIINWQSFSIGAAETTRFIQQSTASSVLNRVVGQDMSVLLGTLQSNGKVFLINPAGILIGQGARIDVGSFVASTLNITDQNFLAGKLNFSGAGAPAVPGAVQNFGTITTPEGGSVYLVAPSVENHGVITSPKGEVLLAAGTSVKLVDTGTPNVYVEITAPDNQALNLGSIIADSGRIGISAGLIRQQGVIRADSAVLGENGKVVLKATRDVTLDAASVTTANGPSGGSVTIQSQSGTTMVSGKVEATGSEAKGGTIRLLGNQVGLVDQAQVSASGQTGGGTVLVGGDYQGKNPDVQNATATYVGSDVQISADAVESGAGGKVVVWANDATRFYGAITARGGAQSGDGGLVETSGKQWLDFRGTVDTSAPHGAMGTLLLDPKNIDVNDCDCTSTPPGSALFTDNPSGDSVIFASSINSQTSNVLLQANNDITFTSPVNIATSGATLTAQAGRSILVNANITTNNADVRLTANETVANGMNSSFRDAGAASLSMATGTTINAGTGNIFLRMNDGTGAGTSGSIVVENLSANNISILNSSSSIVLNSNVLAAGGITITASGDLVQTGGTINNVGNLTAAGTNDVTLRGNNVALGSVASQRDLLVTAGGMLSVGNVQAFGAQNFHVDDSYFSYTLPFAFDFYGTSYTTAYISSNGVIFFGSGSGDYTNSTASMALYRMVAPAWNDWVTYTAPQDVYITDAAGGLTVRWNVAAYANGSLLAQFEATLGRNNNITFNYGPANSSFAGDVTIGLSNQSAASTLVSQLMSVPSFSMNRLNSTTFSYNAGSGSYTEAVSAGSNWVNAVDVGIGGPTSAGVLSALRNATLSAGNSIALTGSLTASNNLAVAAGGTVWLSDAIVSAGGAVSVGSALAPVDSLEVTSANTPASLLAGTSLTANVTNDVTVQGGGSTGASAEILNTGPAAFNINAGGNVSVLGGSGQGAYARLFGNPDMSLTIGGNLNVTRGSGTGAFSRVQAASPNSIIIAFTSPTSQIMVDNVPFDPAVPGNLDSGLVVGSLSTPVAATSANLQVSGGANPSSPPPLPLSPPPLNVEPVVLATTSPLIQAIPTADTAASQTISTPPTDILTTATIEESLSDSEKKDDKTQEQKQAATGQSDASKTSKPKPQLCN